MPDLDTLAYRHSFDHTVLHPATGEPIGLTVTFAGPGHPQAMAADEAERIALLQRREQRQQEAETAARQGRTLPAERETVAESRSRNARWVAARILTSTPVTVAGNDLVLTPETAAPLLEDPRFGWLADSLVVALSSKASFMPVSGPVS